MKWIPTTVGDVCLPTSQTDPARGTAATFKYVDIAGVDRDAKAISRTDKISCSDAPSRARKVIRANDVIVSTVRPNLNAVALVPDELDGEIASTGFTVLRANLNLLLPKFLFYWVQHPAFVDFLVAKSTGASYPAVTDNIVKRSPLSLPATLEQSRIVELLDEADGLRKLRRKADAKAARILPALFVKMFGDPATNPMGWSKTTVGAVTTATDYGTSTKASDDGYGLPLIRMGNVDYDGSLKLDELKYVELSESEASRFRLQKGDILFNRTNSKELVGKTGLWDVDLDAVLASYFIRVRVDNEQVEPTFLWALMNSGHMKHVLRTTARGAIGQANINTTELRALPIFKPPIELQQEFRKRWKAIRATVPKSADPADLDDLFSLMLDRAFSGQLTAQWRKTHSSELLAEMAQQARALGLPLPNTLETQS